jgi:outer membrane protein assembly factor BamB
MKSSFLYAGLKAHVVAIDQATGATVWQTKLAGGVAVSGERFVNLLAKEGRVFAHTYGEIFCLDAQTGSILWKNKLDGLGYDLAALAVEGATSPSASAMLMKKKYDDIAASAAITGAQ